MLLSLVDSMMEDCVLLDRRTASNGMGGYTQQYVDGAAFQAAIVKDSTPIVTVADKPETAEKYTVTTRAAVELQFHDIFRRTSDGKTFRVTNEIQDSAPPPPASAVMRFRQVTAERWEV